MTNRQWLESLSDEELAKYFDDEKVCKLVINQYGCCASNECECKTFNCNLYWLQAEHKEKTNGKTL